LAAVFGNGARGGITTELAMVRALDQMPQYCEIVRSHRRPRRRQPARQPLLRRLAGRRDADADAAASLARDADGVLTSLPVPLMTARIAVIAGWAQATPNDPEGRCRRLDDVGEATAVIEDGFAASHSIGEQLWLPELHRLRCECLHRTGESLEHVARAYATAVETATKQCAVAFTRRAQTNASAA
jgi:hypothetical protein